MKKSFVCLAGGLLGLSFLLSLPAVAGALEDATARLNANDPAGAYALLKPEEKTNAGNPDFDYALGVAALDTGRGSEAVTAFERVLAVRPDHLQARAELGRAYIAINEPEAARREIASVEATADIPPEVRTALNRYVTALDTGLSGGGTAIHGNVTVKSGYDSNVNNSTSDSRVLIPAFAGLGFATLNGGATKQDDGFAETYGRVSVSHGISIDRKIIADISASYRGNFHEEKFNQAIAGLNIGIAQTTPDSGTFSLIAQAQSYWVDDDAYRYTYGALGQWMLSTKGKTDYSAVLQYAHQTYPNGRIQDSDRVTLGGTVGQYFEGAMKPYVFGGIYGGIEETEDSAVDHLSYYFVGARVGTEVQVSPRISVYATAAVENDEYKSADPLFLEKRSTLRTDLTAGLRYALTPSLKINPDISYTNADSNIVLNTYDRVVASVSLSYDF